MDLGEIYCATKSVVVVVGASYQMLAYSFIIPNIRAILMLAAIEQ
jgi:hypothetical protein